uniref:hypothetical protein n=1 Tax=Amycolatopsis sp. CA-096443 TaxID=3239919 RepID=UPI003F49967B
MSGDQGRAGDSGPWTLWNAAWAYAHAMRAVVEDAGGADAAPGFWDVPEAIVAYAIAAQAEEGGIAALESPQDLAELSLFALHARSDAVRVSISLSTVSPSSAALPVGGDPGHSVFTRLKAEIDAFNRGGPAAVLDDPERRARAAGTADPWLDRLPDAQDLIGRTLRICVREDADFSGDGDVRLRLLADRVPGRADLSVAALQAAVRPDAHGMPEDGGPGEREYLAAQERAKELVEAHGRTEGWDAGAARGLLALLLLAAAADRGETVAAVPWSAVRARTQLVGDGEPAQLLDYIETVVRARGIDVDQYPDPGAPVAAAEHPAVLALRFLRARHAYSDGYDPAPRLAYGWPIALAALDRRLLADRGGFEPGSTVSATLAFTSNPSSGSVVGADWEVSAPPGRIGMADLAPGVPRAYYVRLAYDDTARVLAGKCTLQGPPSATADPLDPF